MKAGGVSYRAVVAILFAGIFCAGAVPASAGTAEQLAASVAVEQPREWRSAFGSALQSLARNAHISSLAFDIAQRAFSGSRIPGGSPEVAARLVFSICLSADRELRRGASQAAVMVRAREAARLAARYGSTAGTGETAQSRLRRQLFGMGPTISSDMGNRPGPQSGPEGEAARKGSSGGGPYGSPQTGTGRALPGGTDGGQ